MSKKNFLLLFAFVSSMLMSCSQTNLNDKIKIENTLDFERTEVIEVSLKSLPKAAKIEVSKLTIQNTETKEVYKSQLIDNNADGNDDAILLKVKIGANKTLTLAVLEAEENKETEKAAIANCKFAPERIDDFAWENDKVAFRVYGPKAQQMQEQGIKGGITSSGVDCWLKRVDYPILESWYKKHREGTGTYHEDTGEGLDNYHVGISRGCGGVGVWIPEEDTLYTSANYTKWTKITSGNVQTKFVLDYANWTAQDKEISETKNLTLNAGSNLTLFDLEISGTATLSVGITLHKKQGEVSYNKDKGWFSYWTPHADSELGTGIVVAPEYVTGVTEIKSETTDASHIYVHLKPINGRIKYYSGFGWKKAGEFKTKSDWEKYLQLYTEKIANPLKVEIL